MSSWPPGLRAFVREFNIKTVVYKGRLYLEMYKAVDENFTPSSLAKERKGWEEWARWAMEQPYKPGTLVNTHTYDTDRFRDCGPGLHVSTESFARNFGDRYFTIWRLIKVWIRPKNVICVPYWTDGKIRCKELWVVGLMDVTKPVYNLAI